MAYAGEDAPALASFDRHPTYEPVSSSELILVLLATPKEIHLLPTVLDRPADDVTQKNPTG
jgi:hypothetical protein